MNILRRISYTFLKFDSKLKVVIIIMLLLKLAFIEYYLLELEQ